MVPLVSVITPTWQRHDVLLRCIESVAAQDYPKIEHVVVSDGPEPGCVKYSAELQAQVNFPEEETDWQELDGKLFFLVSAGAATFGVGVHVHGKVWHWHMPENGTWVLGTPGPEWVENPSME